MTDIEPPGPVERSDGRKRLAQTRAESARRRAVVARREAEAARSNGNARAAAVHEHEADIHQRAVDIHLEAVSLQEAHSRELEDAFSRKGTDERGLREVMTTMRRARDEAELRSEQARTYAMRARERAQALRARRGGEA